MIKGIISGLTDFGLFVEMPSLLAEGMIPLSKLRDDFYEYLTDRQELRGQRTRRTFRLGQNSPSYSKASTSPARK